jgi:hypothetical protein
VKFGLIHFQLLLMLLCILPHDTEDAKALMCWAGGLELNGDGFPTAVMDEMLLG